MTDERVEPLERALDALRNDVDGVADQTRRLQRLGIQTMDAPAWVEADPRNLRRRFYPLSNMHLTRGFGCLAQFLCGVPGAADRLVGDFGFEKTALAEAHDSTGGVLVPDDFASQLIVLQEKYGVARGNVTPLPMGSDRTVVPRLSGTLTVYCPGEGQSPTESEPTFNLVALTAKEWVTYSLISRQLDEDAAMAIGTIMANQIAHSFAKKEDQCVFRGDATSTYFNITGYEAAFKNLGTRTNSAGIKVATGDAFSEVVLADLEGVPALLPDFADDDAQWYCHRKFYWEVMVRLAMAAGSSAATEIMSSQAREKTFLGYPVRFTSAMRRTTDSTDQLMALLGTLDLSMKIGERRVREVATSSHYQFASGQIAVRGSERIDIVIHDIGNNTATEADKEPGPVVALFGAAS